MSERPQGEMTGHGDDDLVETEALLALWRAREGTEELFAALRDPMRRAARRGIRRILGSVPDEADVDDVVLKAFKELLEADRTERKRSLVGFACTVASRRGMDRARAIIREREQIKRQAWQLDQLRVQPEDEVAAARRERLLQLADDCMSGLTAEQRDVIEATIQRQVSLSDWVASRKTSYEAGRRLRERALAAIRRCIDTKLDADRKEDSDG